MEKNRIIIVGGGFAGLAAGIYGQMNGYATEIFEMHDKPGGLCTSWGRKGYTIDACIHWLVGSNPRSRFNDTWKEVGILPGREFIDMDLYLRYEASDGRIVNFYCDIDRLEKHLTEFSPADATAIRDFTNAIRMVLVFDQSGKDAPLLHRLGEKAALGWALAVNGRKMTRWMKTTIVEFVARLKDPVLKEAFSEIWIPEFSLFFMLFAFAWLHKRNAGYPLGGSMPMSRSLEEKYLKLGGTIRYNSKVEKILTEKGKATGVVLKPADAAHAKKRWANKAAFSWAARAERPGLITRQMSAPGVLLCANFRVNNEQDSSESLRPLSGLAKKSSIFSAALASSRQCNPALSSS